MADIIASRKTAQLPLISSFREVVNHANRKNKKGLLSPITITLGDEFQSVVKSLQTGLDIIADLEERIILTKKEFKLRYVLLQGRIDTRINTKVAYEMLGPGLTSARKYLEGLKKEKYRFYFNLLDKQKSAALNDSFLVLQNLIDKWRPGKDYYLVSEFLQHKDYKKVAKELSKERSLIWKRERSLKMEDYFSIKKVIKYIGEV